MANSPNTQPIFIRTPLIKQVVLTSELGDRSPSSSTVPKTLLIGGDPATAIESIQIQATAIGAANVVRFYIYDPTETSPQSRLIREVPIPEVSGATNTNALTIPAPVSPPAIVSVQNTAFPIEVWLPPTLSPASSNPNLPNRLLRIPNGLELRVGLGTASPSAPIIVTAFGGVY